LRINLVRKAIIGEQRNTVGICGSGLKRKTSPKAFKSCAWLVIKPKELTNGVPDMVRSIKMVLDNAEEL
jgi:hypothetical protein